MIRVKRVLMLMLLNVIALIFLACNADEFSKYFFMILEVVGLLIVVYYELYSRNQTEILEFNKQLDNYYNDKIAICEQKEDLIFDARLNLPEHKTKNPSDLKGYLLVNDQPYKLIVDQIEELKKKVTEKIEFDNYHYVSENCKKLLGYFIKEPSSLLKGSQVSVRVSGQNSPEYPSLISMSPFLKNSILILGYYLILNGFALQVINQVCADIHEKNKGLNIGMNNHLDDQTNNVTPKERGLDGNEVLLKDEDRTKMNADTSYWIDSLSSLKTQEETKGNKNSGY